jgi:hypothetical protein
MHKKLGSRREIEDSKVFGISLNKYHEDCTGQIMICRKWRAEPCWLIIACVVLCVEVSCQGFVSPPYLLLSIVDRGKLLF